MQKCFDCGCAVEDGGQAICNECHIKRYSAPKPGSTMLCSRCGKSFVYNGGGWNSSKKKAYCSNSCLTADEEEERAREEAFRTVDESTCDSSSSSFSSAEPFGETTSYSSSSSTCTTTSRSVSSAKGGPLEAFLGFCALIALVWGVWKGYNWLFGSGDVVVTEAAMMETWQEHIEQRRTAFSDGLPENEIEAKGLKNYTWEEWQMRQREKLPASSGKTNAEVIGDKAKEVWQNVSTTGVKEVGDKAKALWRSITSKDEKDSEEELKKLNARLAELEGRPQKSAGVASNSYSCDVKFAGDERIVTVASEYGTRSAAWQVAIRVAVEMAVVNFVSDSNLLSAKRAKLQDRLNFVDKTDIKKLEVLKDRQVGDVFTVKIRASFDKKSLTPKFKDIFPTYFASDKTVENQ